MQKVLITGAGGQLGRELQASCPNNVTAVFLDRSQLDITDAKTVQAMLALQQPALVINAAAYTAVDRAEQEAEQARRINTDGAKQLASACAEVSARFVHVSTDFVFSGNASAPYRVDDATGPLSVYGDSKLAGEQQARQANPDTIVVRTGWVYSRFGANFVKTLLRLMAERDTLTVVDDQVGTPTWAAGLAQSLWAIGLNNTSSGTYHWSDAGVCSWYDFALAIAEEGQQLGLLTNAVTVNPIPATAYPTAATRPAYSVLDKSRCWNELNLPATHWRVQLRSMLAQYKEYGDV